MNSKYFDKQKQEKALKWLEDKWPKDKRKCELCATEHWTLVEDLVMPIPFIGGTITLGGNSYPHILLTCNNCGNSKLLNAVVMGLVERAKADENGK